VYKLLAQDVAIDALAVWAQRFWRTPLNFRGMVYNMMKIKRFMYQKKLEICLDDGRGRAVLSTPLHYI
jgi:hypothetical protein